MSDTPVISAKNVWKLFGAKPESYLATMPDGHSYDAIREDGYIAGVKDVSIEVHRGEMFPGMTPPMGLPMWDSRQVPPSYYLLMYMLK